LEPIQFFHEDIRDFEHEQQRIVSFGMSFTLPASEPAPLQEPVPPEQHYLTVKTMVPL
jgi:hypothetical protein